MQDTNFTWNELQTLHPALKTHRDLAFFHFLASPLCQSTPHPLCSSVFLGLPPLGSASRLLQQLCPLPVIPFYSSQHNVFLFQLSAERPSPWSSPLWSLNLKKPSIYVRGSLNIFVMSFMFVCLFVLYGKGGSGGVLGEYWGSLFFSFCGVLGVLFYFVFAYF